MASPPCRYRSGRSSLASECDRHGHLGGTRTSSPWSGSRHRHRELDGGNSNSNHNAQYRGGALMNRFNMPSRRACGGFTLVELMVAMAGFSIISLAAFSVLSSSQRSAVMNDQTVQIQRNVRIAMDIVSRDIRMAGYGNPPKNALSGCVDHLNATDNAIGRVAGWTRIAALPSTNRRGTLRNAFTPAKTIMSTGLSLNL